MNLFTIFSNRFSNPGSFHCPSNINVDSICNRLGYQHLSGMGWMSLSPRFPAPSGSLGPCVFPASSQQDQMCLPGEACNFWPRASRQKTAHGSEFAGLLSLSYAHWYLYEKFPKLMCKEEQGAFLCVCLLCVLQFVPRDPKLKHPSYLGNPLFWFDTICTIVVRKNQHIFAYWHIFCKNVPWEAIT